MHVFICLYIYTNICSAGVPFLPVSKSYIFVILQKYLLEISASIEKFLILHFLVDWRILNVIKFCKSTNKLIKLVEINEFSNKKNLKSCRFQTKLQKADLYHPWICVYALYKKQFFFVCPLNSINVVFDISLSLNEPPNTLCLCLFMWTEEERIKNM